MSKKKIGIFGCGDFLRWQASEFINSKLVEVGALFDPDTARAEKFAQQLGGRVVSNGDEIFADPTIDFVALYVPPWLRRSLIEKAAAAGKHIIATKPLAATIEDCDAILKAVEGHVRAGVLYGRSGDPATVAMKNILEDGRFGKLGLYRQDWIHAYPQWNKWAVDPAKNGGPFMDAMIHNMNLAAWLMGVEPTGGTFFADNIAHPQLACADTESLKLDFGPGRCAYLFITWAADLATYGTEGNNREHIDVFYLVTDKGWRITRESKDGKSYIKASREGKDEWLAVADWSAEHSKQSLLDAFAEAIEAGTALPPWISSIEDAARDIRLIRSLAR